MYIPYPTIPEIATGQVLSASGHLNPLTRANHWLLGWSHRAYSAWHANVDAVSETGDNYVTRLRGYLRHTWNTLYYDLQMYATSGTGNVRIVYINNAGGEQVLTTLASTAGTFERKSGTVDLSGEVAAGRMTVGRVYQFRIQLLRAHCKLWTLSERGSLAGWVAPTDFTDGVTSTAAHFNNLRTDYNLLYAQKVEPINQALYVGNWQTRGNDYENGYAAGVLRYRPNRLYCAIKVNMANAHSSRTWQWRVRMENYAGAVSTLYESPAIASTVEPQWAWTMIDMTGRGLALGDYYKVIVDARRYQSNETLYLQDAVIMRQSTANPGGAWANPKTWAHLDKLTAAELDKYRACLLELYTGGAEELFGEIPAVLFDVTRAGAFSLTHTHRYLFYLPDGTAPVLRYSTLFGKEYTLSAGDSGTWHVFDLHDLHVPYGGAYVVENAIVCFETASNADRAAQGAHA
jgi:hypothetical protein